MIVHINLSDGKPYLLSVADAIATLSDEAGFQSGDQARITCGGLRLPSGEIIILTGLLFERGNRHVFIVWLRSSKRCRARDRSESLDFDTAELADAMVDVRGEVTLADGRVIRAVQPIPAKLPYEITDLDWRMVHQTISAAKAEDRCYLHLPDCGEADLIATARELNLLNYTALLGLDKIPYLKVIQGELLKHDPKVFPVSTPETN
ncbi:hypothetical protein [Afipia broomeae]|uniref:Uncharacterized protein n=1 Tax=Afipia broomeae ATCC 49717 TaxID=883078 RepID=K8PPC0_9BRAD|nr:hypothetical protein [Afipia broomeae]EKS41350.1 hypothetical protein HMPREF9695_00442 [Afipia broomeae ATCC 49717]